MHLYITTKSTFEKNKPPAYEENMQLETLFLEQLQCPWLQALQFSSISTGVVAIFQRDEL